MNNGSLSINRDVINLLSKQDLSDWLDFAKRYLNCDSTENSIFRDVINTKHNMKMISIYRKALIRTVTKNGQKHRYTVRIKGRGSRKGLPYDSTRYLRVADAERFSVYVHTEILGD